MIKKIRTPLLIIMLIFIFLFSLSGIPGILEEEPDSTIGDLVIERGYSDTSSKNLVAAILLDYRLFDSVFEAAILLISAAGVLYMTKLPLKDKTMKGGKGNERQ